MRQKANITQTDLARYINASRSLIAQWETGRVMPDQIQMDAIRQACEAALQGKAPGDVDILSLGAARRRSLNRKFEIPLTLSGAAYRRVIDEIPTDASEDDIREFRAALRKAEVLAARLNAEHAAEYLADLGGMLEMRRLHKPVRPARKRELTVGGPQIARGGTEPAPPAARGEPPTGTDQKKGKGKARPATITGVMPIVQKEKNAIEVLKRHRTRKRENRDKATHNG